MGKYIELNGELFSLNNIVNVHKSEGNKIRIEYYRGSYYYIKYKNKEEMEKDYIKLKNKLFSEWTF